MFVPWSMSWRVVRVPMTKSASFRYSRNFGTSSAYPAIVDRELDRYLPFLATTKVLVAAVRRGVGREQAHEAIKEHAVATALALREGGADNDLLDRLAADARLGLDRGVLDSLLADRLGFVGVAPQQVEAFAAQVADIVDAHPAAAAYRPEPVL
jgi:adenylosuccinate lyase